MGWPLPAAGDCRTRFKRLGLRYAPANSESTSASSGGVGPIRGHRRVLGAPMSPGVDGSVAGDPGARTAMYLVGGDRGTRQDPQRGLPGGTGVGAVEGSVDAEGGARRAGPLASSLSFRAERRRRRVPVGGVGLEDPDRIDYVRTVVMPVRELVELLPRGRGVRGFESDHCRITFQNP